MTEKEYSNGIVIWLARAALGLVFLLNIECALAFLVQPEQYAGSFETSGIPGKVLVQSLGILFLMWNATYPPVLLRPNAQRTLFAIILLQQLIGVIGETWLWWKLPAGHPIISQTGQRFILFDGVGLLLMAAAYFLLVSKSAPEK
jgi:hypothetical protein